MANVFNITVASEHEYFANGVLVGNCDAVLYGWRRAMAWLHTPPPVEAFVRGTPEWYAEQQRKQQAEQEAEFERQFSENALRRQEEAEQW